MAKERDFRSVLLWGRSDLAEIAVLSAVDCGISIVAIVDRGGGAAQFVGKRVISDCRDPSVTFDAVMITDLTDARHAYDEAVQVCGSARVLAPKLLGLPVSQQRGVVQ